MTIRIQITRLPHGEGLPLPSYATSGAAGMDVVAAEDFDLAPGQRHAVATGYKVAIPAGYELQVRPRSGLAFKHGIGVPNSPGTIDSDYRGELKILLINHGSDPVLLPEAQFKDFKAPAPYLQRSPGHYLQWILACKNGGATGSNFDYAGPMTESVLLGNVALRTGKKIEWDAANLKATNCPEADQYIQFRPRKGWGL